MLHDLTLLANGGAYPRPHPPWTASSASEPRTRRQWAAIDPTVEPVGFATRPDGRVAVDVRQVARALDGSLLADARVLHVYAFRGDLVARMDVEEPADTA
jgi:hypothetical protein